MISFVVFCSDNMEICSNMKFNSKLLDPEALVQGLHYSFTNFNKAYWQLWGEVLSSRIVLVKVVREVYRFKYLITIIVLLHLVIILTDTTYNVIQSSLIIQVYVPDMVMLT